MIGLIQIVNSASVEINETVVSSINKGMLLLLGVEQSDTDIEIAKMAKKVANMRVFPDENGKTNLSLSDIDGELLVVSQFTLLASLEKGNRPGFSNAGSPESSKKIYQAFLTHFEHNYGPCKQGQFGADMNVSLVNSGPATYYLKI